jgi:indoleacetamide hydrolase
MPKRIKRLGFVRDSSSLNAAPGVFHNNNLSTKADLANIGDLDAKVSFPVALFEVMTDLPAYLKKYNAGVDLQQLQAGLGSPDVKGLIGAMLEGKPPTIPEAVYKEALAGRPAFQKAFADYFAGNNLVGMIFPTTPAPAQVIATSGDTFDLNGQKAPTFPTFIRNADPGSNAGIPGITVNAGMSASGLPIGIALDGPANSDRELLAIALAMEQVLGPAPVPK